MNRVSRAMTKNFNRIVNSFHFIANKRSGISETDCFWPKKAYDNLFRGRATSVKMKTGEGNLFQVLLVIRNQGPPNLRVKGKKLSFRPRFVRLEISSILPHTRKTDLIISKADNDKCLIIKRIRYVGCLENVQEHV